MNEAHVNIDIVIAAAEAKSASLVPETAGYLVLCAAAAASGVPRLFGENNIFLSLDGDVELGPRCEAAKPLVGIRLLRVLLARLLSVSSGVHAALFAVAHEPSDAETTLSDFASAVETALIPMNRAAAKRALARLAREAMRAQSAGLSGPAEIKSDPLSLIPATARPAPPLKSAPYVPGFPLRIVHEALSQPDLPVPLPALKRPASPGERKLEGMRASLSRSLWGAQINSIQYIEKSMEMPRLHAPVVLTPLPTCVLTPVSRAPVEPALKRPPPAEMDEPFDENVSSAAPAAAECTPVSSRDENAPFWNEASSRTADESPAGKSGCTLRFYVPADTANAGPDGLELDPAEGRFGEASLVTFLDFTPVFCGDVPEATPTVVMGHISFDLDSPVPLSVEACAEACAQGSPDAPEEPLDSHFTLPWPAHYHYDEQSRRASVVPALTVGASSLEVTAPQPTYVAAASDAQDAGSSNMAPGDLEEVPDDAASAGVALEAEELLSVQPETPWTGEPETACAEGAEHLPENSDVTIELNLNECELSSQSAVPLVQAISGDAPPQHAEAQTRPLETPPPDSGHAVTRRMAPRGPDRADELLRAFVAAKEGETYLRAAAKNLRAFAGVDLTPSAAPMNAVSKRNEELSAPVPAGPSAEDLTPPGASKGTEDRRRPRSARLPSSKLARDLFAFGVGLLGATGLLYARPNLADDVISWVARTLPAHPPASPESVEETHSNAGAEPVSTAAEKAAP